MNRCVVIGGAEIKNYERINRTLRDDDFAVFCDSGLRHRPFLHVVPGLIVGDFDSHPRPVTDVETIVLPREKDDTDTVFAVKEAVRRGFRDFLLIGALGGLQHRAMNADYAAATLLGDGAGGYVLAGVAAFMAGVATAVTCIRRRNKNDRK